MSLLKQLIATDRNGNWENHLQMVQCILPIFSKFDSFNYYFLRTILKYIIKL